MVFNTKSPKWRRLTWPRHKEATPATLFVCCATSPLLPTCEEMGCLKDRPIERHCIKERRSLELSHWSALVSACSRKLSPKTSWLRICTMCFHNIISTRQTICPSQISLTKGVAEIDVFGLQLYVRVTVLREHNSPQGLKTLPKNHACFLPLLPLWTCRPCCYEMQSRFRPLSKNDTSRGSSRRKQWREWKPRRDTQPKELFFPQSFLFFLLYADTRKAEGAARTVPVQRPMNSMQLQVSQAAIQRPCSPLRCFSVPRPEGQGHTQVAA